MILKLKPLFVTTAILSCLCMDGQVGIERLKSFGGSGGENMQDFTFTNHEGIVALALMGPSDGMVQCNAPPEHHQRVWMFELNKDWDIEWQQCYSAPEGIAMRYIEKYGENKYVVLGYNLIRDSSYITCWKGARDIWLWVLDSAGNRIEQRCYGGSNIDNPNDFRPTSDGGYLVSCYTMSSDKDLKPHYAQLFFEDAWTFKLDSNLSIEWSFQWGGTDREQAFTAMEHPYGGFLVGAASFSEDGDVGSNLGEADAWLIRLDDTGGFVWQRRFGEFQGDVFYDMLIGPDSMLYIGGVTSSGYCSSEELSGDYWLVKTDLEGNEIWQQCYGGSRSEDFTGLDTFNGNILLAGRSGSSDGDVVGSYSNADDIWLVEVDTGGEIVSTRIIGSKYNDEIKSIKNNIGVGTTEAKGHDITNYYGEQDGIIFELGIPTGMATPSKLTSRFEITQNFTSEIITISGSKLFKSYTVQVNSILGRIYHMGRLEPGNNSIEFTTKPFTKGIYIITIRQGDTGEIVFTKKVFVH